MAQIMRPISRCLHLSSCSTANVHRAFRKVLASNSSKKRKLQFQDFPVLPSMTNSKQDETTNKFKPGLRRASVLNKLYMRYVTDLIVNSENWETYTKLGIEITKVEISQDFQKLNIFWITKKSNNENLISEFLANNAYTLRHELSQLKIVGIVPPISFVKDKYYSTITELDKRMEKADYGDDYEPLSVSRLKCQLELYRPLEEDIKLQLEKIEEDKEEEPADVDLPRMPQNVLGLDHADIMRKILNPKKIQPTSNISGGIFTRNASALDYVEDAESSRDAFISFLHKRQLLSQKLKKEDKNYNPDMEVIKEELTKSFEEHYDNIEENLDKFEDYIEEEKEEK